MCKPSNWCKIKKTSFEVSFYGKKKRKSAESGNAENDAGVSEKQRCQHQERRGCKFRHAGHDVLLFEGALDEKLNEELVYSKYDYKNKSTDNSRNGHSKKTMHTDYGDMDVSISRDRNGEYKPQLIKKYQNTVTQDMEEKLLSMYAKGMTTGDIEAHMRELYDIEVSDSTISRITDKILPIVKEWQERPLEEVYAVVYMDAIHYHVCSADGRNSA